MRRVAVVGRTVPAALGLAAAGVVAACGSATPVAAAPTASAAAAAVSMATSVATTADSWAMVPVASGPAFWQVLARPGNATAWKLVTPPGVAINGGIVASPDGRSALTVAVRPSQKLTFTPLAATANGGGSWSPGGPITAAVAASPDALAADGSHLAALLSDGAVQTSADAGKTWSTLAKPGAIAVSAAARGCDGTVRITALSFGASTADVLAGGSCGTGSAAAVFSYSPGSGWQRLGLPASGRLVRLAGGMALVRGASGLRALWRGFGWYAYAPLSGTPRPVPTNWTESASLPLPGAVVASGSLQAGGAWVLASGGRAAMISAAGVPRWVTLPPTPAHTTVLAAGPDGAMDALAVSGATVTVWRLPRAGTTWSESQVIKVPVQYGSSG